VIDQSYPVGQHGGYVLYLRQEVRGIGLYDKLDAYTLQDRGLDTYDANLALGHQADERDYTSAAQMLHALGADRIVLHLTGANAAYLATKARRGGHDLLSRSFEDAAGHAGPFPGPADLGFAAR